MRWIPGVALLALTLLNACTQSSIDLTTVARDSQVTLNAENDVYGLTVRYHEAIERAAAYRPLVDAEETRLRELQEALRSLRADTGQVSVEMDKLNAEKTALTTARDAINAELAVLREALSALETEKSKVEAETAALTQATGNHTAAVTALKNRQAEEEALRKAAEASLVEVTERRAALEAELRDAEKARGEMVNHLEAIRTRTESLRPSVLSTEVLLQELERRVQAAKVESPPSKD